MVTQDTITKFEARYPPPESIYYDEKSNKYKSAMPYITGGDFDKYRHNLLWQGYQSGAVDAGA